MKELTSEQLKKELSYNPETGVFIRLKAHKTLLVGKEAGCIALNGYRQISLYSRTFKAHRLAFLYMTGEWPKQQVDHMNGNKLDNRWENLREVSNMVNGQNRLGKGYVQTPYGWQAKIVTNYKPKCLGTFKTEEEANAAYLAAKQTYHAVTTERKYGKKL